MTALEQLVVKLPLAFREMGDGEPVAPTQLRWGFGVPGSVEGLKCLGSDRKGIGCALIKCRRIEA
jgi:hypothetical protein